MKIKRSNAIKSFVILGVLLTLFGFQQVVRAETERINDFNATITIQKDGSVFVTENIIYDFGSNQKHGIFRDIPLTAINGPRLNINVSGVSDDIRNEFGQSYQYTTSITNNVLRIKIGDPNVFVTGIKNYIINYQVDNAIRTFNNHEELYWNVTGNQWPVAIQNAKASVTLPDSPIPNDEMDCFTGLQGDTQKNCIFTQADPSLNYWATQRLNADEGLTLVLGMPLGYIQNTYVPSPQIRTTTASGDIFAPLFFTIFAVAFTVGMSLLFARRAKKAKP